MDKVMYDFKTRINREGTGSAKWDLMYTVNPDVSFNVVPLSIADMEFVNAPEIRKGLQKYLDTAILGYQVAYDDFNEAVVNWQAKRYDWSIKKEWIVDANNVVMALYAAVRAFTEENDGVIIFRPSYPPFGNAIDVNHRTEVGIPLLNDGGYYTIDFDQFEEAALDPNNKMLILCNPHNPVGRVWTKEELEKIAEISVKHNLTVVSDEIWRDFTMPGYEYTPLATVNTELTPSLMTCTSASKSFNLGGLKLASIIIEDEKLREKFQEELTIMGGSVIGPLAYKGVELAYTKAEPWLDEVLKVIDTNQNLVHDFFKENYPKIKAPKIEGTYVQWIDVSEVGMTDEEMAKFLEQEAEFFTGHGTAYGLEEGRGYERINLALPTEILRESLERLVNALKKREEA